MVVSLRSYTCYCGAAAAGCAAAAAAGCCGGTGGGSGCACGAASLRRSSSATHCSPSSRPSPVSAQEACTCLQQGARAGSCRGARVEGGRQARQGFARIALACQPKLSCAAANRIAGCPPVVAFHADQVQPLRQLLNSHGTLLHRCETMPSQPCRLNEKARHKVHPSGRKARLAQQLALPAIQHGWMKGPATGSHPRTRSCLLA